MSDLSETLSCHRSECARIGKEAAEAKSRVTRLELILSEREAAKERLEKEIRKLQSGLGEAGDELEHLRKTLDEKDIEMKV